MRTIFSWFCWILFVSHAGAQCEFTGNLAIADEGVTGLNLIINNALVNDLADPSQGVCQVLIKFKHEVVGDINVSLVSPSGQQVQLIGPGGASSGFTDETVWDIKFTSCLSPASPDLGYSEFWDNTESWQAFQTYTGTYYPHSGCLEDFNSGTVNGTWTLLIEDVVALDAGEILYFSILFCDTEGIDCSSCIPPQAQIDQDSVTICRGINWQDNDIDITWPVSNPDTLQYKPAFLIFNNSGYIGTTKDTLVSSLDSGRYKLCLLYYHQSDSLNVDSLPLGFQDTLAAEVLVANGICGNLTDCIPLTILPVSDTIMLTKILCEGDTFQFANLHISEAGIYYVAPNEANCDTIIQLNVIERKIVPEVVLSHPVINCNHEFIDISLLGLDAGASYSYQWGTDLGHFLSATDTFSVRINAAGNYFFTVKSDGCLFSDTVSIQTDMSLPQLDLSAALLTCDSFSVTIVLNSNIPLISASWFGPQPILTQGQNARVAQPGIYRVEVEDQNGCLTNKSIQVFQDIAKPGLEFAVQHISCTNETAEILIIDSFNIKTALWTGPAPENNQMINTALLLPGLYQLKLSGFNGCDTLIEVGVNDSSYEVDVVLIPDTLNCFQIQTTLVPFSSRVIVDQLWTYPDMSLRLLKDPVINAGGLYSVVITDSNGCTGMSSVFIETDTIAPVPIADDKVLDCDSSSVLLWVTNAGNADSLSWEGPMNFSSSEPAIRVIQPGAYFVTITAPNGCQGSEEVEVSISQDLPDITFMIDTISCRQAIARLEPSDTSGIDFLWLSTDMLNLPNASLGEVNLAGSYRVRVTDRTNGCNREYDLTVTDGRVLSDYMVKADTLGCLTSKSALRVSGNIKVKSFTWTANGFLSTDPSPMVDKPGWYYLTMIDSMDCAYLDSVEVIEALQAPDVSIQGQNIDCSHVKASLTASAEMGVSFLWQKEGLDLGNGASITVFNPGVYRVIATGAGLCSDTAYYEVVLDTLPPLLSISLLDTLSCEKDSVLLEVYSNKQLASAVWQGPGGFASDVLRPVVTLAGLYSLEVVDSAGCVANLSIEVQKDTGVLTYDTLVSDITCVQNGSVKIDFSSEIIDIDWISSPVPVMAGTIEFETTEAGSYTFEAVNASGCKAGGTIEIKYDTLPPNISGLQGGIINCKDTLVYIGFLEGLPPGVTVLWSQGNQVSDSIRVDTTGIFTGAATGNNGCTIEFEAAVMGDFDAPVFQTLGDTITCSKSKTDLQVISNDVLASVSWTAPDGTQFQGIKVKVEIPGMYDVTVTGDNGCVAVDTAWVLSDFELPQISVPDTIYLPCDGSGVVLLANSQDSLISFKWLGLDQTYFSELKNPRVFTANTIKVSAASFNGCEASDTIRVVPSRERPVYELRGDSIGCQPASATLIALDVSDDSDHFWKDESGNVYRTDSLMLTSPGLYTLVVIGNNGCRDSLSTTVGYDTIRPKISIAKERDLRCEKNSTVLTGLVNSNGQPFTFEWFTSNGQFSQGTQSLTPMVIAAGIYTLKAVNAINGCESSDSIGVNRISNTLEVTYDVINPKCRGDLNGSISIGQVNNGMAPFEWNLNGTPINDTQINGLAQGNYQLMLKDIDGCQATDTVMLSNISAFVLTLPADTSIVLGESVQLSYTLLPQNHPINSIQWLSALDGTVLCENCPDFGLQPEDDISIILLGIDSLGCETSDTIRILVTSSVNLQLPNAFQPGTSGSNAWFYIADYPFVEKVEYLRVYDNWGNLIFSRENFPSGIPELGWDGKFHGTWVIPGVYVYQLALQLKGGLRLVRTRDITVVR